jgi:short-subunit dehydrogenase
MATNAQKKTIIIFGMGPGNGMAIAEKFGQDGYQVIMVARDPNKLTAYSIQLAAKDITAIPFNIDLSNEKQIERLAKQLLKKFKAPDVIVYNASTARLKNILEESIENIENDLKVNLMGAFSVTKSFWRAMADRSGGSIFFTGGGLSVKPVPEYGSLALGKAALRNLTYSLAKTLESKNIHVATVTIMDKLSADHPRNNYQAVADKMWELHQQPPGRFNTEVQW